MMMMKMMMKYKLKTDKNYELNANNWVVDVDDDET
jgi:hypothetical protein